MARKSKTPALPQVRKLKFPFDPERAANWLGRKSASHVFNGMSLMFPEGEREFIESVKPFVQQVTDPKLREQAEAFTKQEAHHMREHARYNEILEELGFPAKKLEEEIRRKTKWGQKNLSLRTRIAFTAAAEHFTAILADALLSEEFDWSEADETFATFWRWHAIEEIEHKAVAFDVYDTTVGSYWHRVRIMFFVTLIFSYDIARHGSEMMRADGMDPSEGWRDVRKLFFKETKLGWRILRNYLRYYKPGFHPWDIDNRALVKKWNDAYDGLMDRLGMAA